MVDSPSSKPGLVAGDSGEAWEQVLIVEVFCSVLRSLDFPLFGQRELLEG